VYGEANTRVFEPSLMSCSKKKVIRDFNGNGDFYLSLKLYYVIHLLIIITIIVISIIKFMNIK